MKTFLISANISSVLTICFLVLAMTGCATVQHNTYTAGYSAGVQFCEDWGYDTFGSDSSINNFIAEFSIPTKGPNNTWDEELDNRAMNDCQKGAHQAFCDMIGDWNATIDGQRNLSE